MKLKRSKLYELRQARICLAEQSNEVVSYPRGSILMFIGSNIKEGGKFKGVERSFKTWHHHFLNNDGDTVIFYQPQGEFEFSPERWADAFLRKSI